MNTVLPFKRIAASVLSLILPAFVLPYAGAAPVPGGWDTVQGKRILYLTKSSGFEHSVVKRGAADQLSHSERILASLGQKHGFEVTCTIDGRAFSAENLARYDVIVFYTSGDLFTKGTDGTPAMTPGGKAALLAAIRGGKGFVGVHPSTDSFHYRLPSGVGPETFIAHGSNVDPFIAMLGGEFIRHGPQQTAAAIVIDAKFPGCEGLKGSFDLLDEWYTFKDFAPDLHVVLALQTRGMKGIDYQRAPFPYTWARRHGQGRVFYTGLGHREDVWSNPVFQNLLLG
jgi:type 1 glutamine amidotransferase